jgi:hypothetical protein
MYYSLFDYNKMMLYFWRFDRDTMVENKEIYEYTKKLIENI